MLSGAPPRRIGANESCNQQALPALHRATLPQLFPFGHQNNDFSLAIIIPFCVSSL
jgi:hypothetical protein